MALVSCKVGVNLILTLHPPTAASTTAATATTAAIATTAVIATTAASTLDSMVAAAAAAPTHPRLAMKLHTPRPSRQSVEAAAPADASWELRRKTFVRRPRRGAARQRALVTRLESNFAGERAEGGAPAGLVSAEMWGADDLSRASGGGVAGQAQGGRVDEMREGGEVMRAGVVCEVRRYARD